MIRTQIYLTEQEKSGLESVALAKGVSQSDLVRQAIDDLLARAGEIDKSRILDEIAGVWAQRTDVPDIRDLRTGWHTRSSR
ncbi:MAG: ribbon-helix-helix protein, CopG family [Chitinivibrionales bacterium]|nr:ribbon-helix-helix protein, CopG family [Chitinivibrionales bacterium]